MSRHTKGEISTQFFLLAHYVTFKVCKCVKSAVSMHNMSYFFVLAAWMLADQLLRTAWNDFNHLFCNRIAPLAL